MTVVLTLKTINLDFLIVHSFIEILHFFEYQI